jgi:hypothetical protein
VIGRLPKGTTGLVLGSATDDTGLEWWFVAIEPGQTVADCIYYATQGGRDYKLGWVCSRFVERIGE